MCELPSAFRDEIRKARIGHECCECSHAIVPGERYEYASGIWDGRPDDFKTCLGCVGARRWYLSESSERCSEYGALDSELHEQRCSFADLCADVGWAAGLLMAARLRWDDQREAHDVALRRMFKTHALVDFAQLDYVLREMNAVLTRGEYAAMDAWMGRLDAAKCAPVTLIAILSITKWERDKFPRRAEFMARAEESLVARLGEERTERLLVNRR